MFRSMSRLLLLVGKRRILLADAGMTAEWICLNPNLDMGVLKKENCHKVDLLHLSFFIQAVGIKKKSLESLSGVRKIHLKTLQD